MKVIEVHEGIVYSYTNIINGKKYIGETIHEDKRKYMHLYSATVNFKNFKSKFYNAIRKYGYDNFIYEVLFRFESIDKAILKDIIRCKEIEIIDHYDTVNSGYNLTTGGVSKSHYKTSNKTKSKIRNANIGRIVSNETRALKYKSVLQYTKDNVFIREFESIKHAAKEVNVTASNISAVCTGRRLFCAGYIWKHAD